MDLEWIRVLLEKLHIHSVIGACVFVSLCALLFSEKIWILILIGSISFLLIEGGIFSYKHFCKCKVKKKSLAQKNKSNEESIQRKKDGIWHLFIGLSDENMGIAQEIFYEESDPYDNHIRIIRKMNALRDKIDSLGYCGVHPFYASIDGGDYIPCIKEKTTGDSIIIQFDPYFYTLLEFYIEHKFKEKL